MFIRWLGAFRKNGSLSEAISFEMVRETPVACEQLQKGKSFVDHARVALLVDPKAVYKRFKGDVWSEYTPDGKLYACRPYYDAFGKHKESWAKPVYTGLVIKGGSLATLSFEAREQIKLASKKHSLPVYRLVQGKLIPEESI